MFDKEVKPCIVSPNKKMNELQAKKTYFMQQPNGTVIAMEAREAWDKRKKMKLVGVSDGKAYREAVAIAQEVLVKEGLEAAQEILRMGYEDEWKKAEGNLEPLQNFDVFGKGAKHLMKKL